MSKGRDCATPFSICSTAILYCLTAQSRRQVRSLWLFPMFIYRKETERKQWLNIPDKRKSTGKRNNVAVHGCNPSKQEVEKENPGEFKAVQDRRQVPGQPGLHNKEDPVSKNKQAATVGKVYKLQTKGTIYRKNVWADYILRETIFISLPSQTM